MEREEIYAAILSLRRRFDELGIGDQIDYQKFYLYSIITHSTAIEGSTVTEIENQLMFDEGISASGRSLVEQMMNIDLRNAYLKSISYARNNAVVTIPMLCELSSLVMKNTGSKYSTMQGEFDSSKGDLRLVNVSAGVGGRSYMNYMKVPVRLKEFCDWINYERSQVNTEDIIAAYRISFLAHYRLVTIHPWVDGNGRMSRLLMNQIQWEFGLLPTIIYKEHKAEYINSLIRAREEEDEQIFCDFMFEELLEFYRKNIQEYETSQEREESYVPVNVPLNITERQHKILELMKAMPNITIREIATRFSLNEKTIKRDVAKLRSANLLRRIGADKNGKWEVTATL